MPTKTTEIHNGIGEDEKREFRAALAYFGISIPSWAKARKLTSSHVYFFLAGARKSTRLTKEIQETIDEFRGTLGSVPQKAA